MIPDWEDTIWPTEFMAPGLVYEGFLIDPHVYIPLLINDLLWELPNRQAMQGGRFIALLGLLGITPLLNNLRSVLKVQWSSL